MSVVVSIYIKGTAGLLVPHTQGATTGMVETEPVVEVTDITNRDLLWGGLRKAREFCNVEPSASPQKKTVLERYWKSKSFEECYRGVRLISYSEIDNYGIYLYPSKRDKKAFVFSNPISIGKEVDGSMLFEMFAQALERTTEI